MTFEMRCKTGLLFFIYASNEPKSVLARDLGDCRDNLRNSRSVFLIVLWGRQRVLKERKGVDYEREEEKRNAALANQ